ncbi:MULTISPECIES: hypothetical protein [Mycobacterium]|uniref:hypothetical protein n=1 Tax=Mycobacterium TaxID=1763 RepID=UPI0012E37080|nr:MULTISPECIES: hypothetical protein [Mycobacterium]MCV7034827.1 hypothetical protein [Mycobacterium heckeshornense]
MFEQGLMRLLADPPQAPPVSLVQWVVTGKWPPPAMRVDVAFASEDCARQPWIDG